MKTAVTPSELREVPLFSGVSDAALTRLLECSAEVDARNGQVLALQDAPGSGAFVVLDGAVTVEVRGRSFEIGAGETVGELALLVPDATRVARVRATDHARCLSIPREDFLELVENEPSFALALLRELARRLVDVHATP
jgi:CRP/FNR family cyclic AMP-dependent transcriptional regulator